MLYLLGCKMWGFLFWRVNDASILRSYYFKPFLEEKYWERIEKLVHVLDRILNHRIKHLLKSIFKYLLCLNSLYYRSRTTSLPYTFIFRFVKNLLPVRLCSRQLCCLLKFCDRHSMMMLKLIDSAHWLTALCCNEIASS